MAQGVEHEWIVTMDELYATFEKARKAGKVRFFGLATHTNVPKVCELAAKSGRYDVVMLAMNPNSLKTLAPAIQTMRKADVGVVSMKASGAVQKDPKACDAVYGEVFEGQSLTAYQRANAYLLFRGGVDAFNSHMPNEKILLENLVIPTLKLGRASLDRLEDVAVAEASTACLHCGACSRACPNDVPVADMLRCHAYMQNYRDPWLARDLYAAVGAERISRCTGCATCRSACPQAYDLPTVVASVKAVMA
jgi:predicted aldo/keto reductase-like oxidoreductase